jgi:hypothetical protein
MKPASILLRFASFAAFAVPVISAAQTAAPPVASTPPAPPAKAAATGGSAFDNAPPAVVTAVQNAQAIANTIRTGVGVSTTQPNLARAVSQASAAIVQDGRATRADLLAERQAALARLRAAQTAQERERLIGELRTAAGQRMDEQREVARLVRDRLRELRDITSLTRP